MRGELLIAFWQLDDRGIERIGGWNQRPARCQQPLPCVDDALKVAVIQRQHPSQIRDDYIGFLGKGNVGGKPLHELDAGFAGRQKLQQAMN